MAPVPFFMGLSKSQTQSLAIGAIIVGLGLFMIASFTWKNKDAAQIAMTPNVSVTPSLATPSGTITNMPSKMISATSTANLAQKQPMVKKLPNTSSKVTYTVEENDSIATIGEALCGIDRAWLSIAATNNLFYPYTIHAGEEYIITCQ